VSRPPTGARGPVLWALLAPVGLLVLVGVVVAASSGHDVGGGSLRSETATSAFATLLFALGAVWVAGLLVASPLVTGLTARAEVRQRRRWSEGFILLLVIVSVLFLLVGSNRLGNGRNGNGQEAPTIGGQDPRGRVSGRPLATPPIDWVIVLTVFGVALAAFSVTAGMLVRGNKNVRREVEARKALAQILDDTLDDLRAEKDPRKAVIAAYSRMEQSLASFGLPRRPFEAPAEYLGRVLEELQAGSPSARRLTHLFERAKFSQHTIDAEMKEEAIEAVVALREELSAELVAAAAT
jgi:Domain of unknown function (DUF4129)